MQCSVCCRSILRDLLLAYWVARLKALRDRLIRSYCGCGLASLREVIKAVSCMIFTPAFMRLRTRKATMVFAKNKKGEKIKMGANDIVANMPATVIEINVKVGDSVKRGDVLIVTEAMKMKNKMMTRVDGKVSEIKVTVGQSVRPGEVLVVLE
jgi:biotin carboxyl carrier protein